MFLPLRFAGKIVDYRNRPLVPCTLDAMTSFQAPRGTTDILPDDQRDRLAVQRVCAELAETFGYAPILTPTFEDSDLFLRTTGESTDIVQKETYTFDDRGGHSLTLRPEGTPGRLPGVSRKGTAQHAPARAALLHHAHVPVRATAGRSVPRVLAVRRRGARRLRSRLSTPRSSSLRGACWNRSV